MVLRSARDTFLRFFQTPSQPSLPAVDAAQPTFAIPAPPAASALQARRERRQTWCGPRKLSRVSFGGALVLNKVNVSQFFLLWGCLLWPHWHLVHGKKIGLQHNIANFSANIADSNSIEHCLIEPF
jgi:hypothetical protein